MKVSISYPPLASVKGVPLLAQNRQFQWFNNPTYIYPVIPAYAATLLKNNGYDVFWDDGIAENLTYANWLARIIAEKPDVVVLETKTPVIKLHWKIINELKEKLSTAKIVLMGDHTTALPEESLFNSKVDYVIKGGDYDFILSGLVESLETKQPPPPGIWYRHDDLIVNSGDYDLHRHSLEELPLLDRQLTNWRAYAYKNGNFKYTPGAYMMSGRDCWWGKCSFCSWTTLFPGNQFRIQSPRKALLEVQNLIALGAKEIMEDSGTLPIGKWLEEFCNGMINNGFNKKIRISCNMRINAIKDARIWQMMRQAGFRWVLFGLESANQQTLDRINKNLRVEEIEPSLKLCSEAGLEPHITAMIGYPWETYEDAKRTVDLAQKIFRKGYIKTLQATVVIPYPGTKLYDDCKSKGLLNFDDYNRFDQREQVMKSPLTTNDAKELTSEIYKSFFSLAFFFRQITTIRSWADIRYLFFAVGKLLGHLIDFRRRG